MKIIVILLLSISVLISCSTDTASLVRAHGYTMGTSYNIQWVGDASQQVAIQQQIDTLLDDVNKQMSTYRNDSELSLFNHASAPYSQEISPEFASVVRQSFDIYHLTEGYFDISVGPLVNLWGFGPDKRPSKQPSANMVEAVKKNTGLDEVALVEQVLSKKQQRYLDLSAIAKGFAVDEIADFLMGLGYANYLVEVGGEIRAGGHKQSNTPWKIAIEAPDIDERRVQKILSLDDVAIATSGDYRNFYEVDGVAFSHTIDPFTGYPVQHTLASVTILSHSCAQADALATAMLAMGHEKGMQFAQKNALRAYFVVREGSDFIEYLSPAFASWLNP